MIEDNILVTDYDNENSRDYESDFSGIDFPQGKAGIDRWIQLSQM